MRVDANLVERAIHRPFQSPAQHAHRNIRISCNERQHSRHIGRYHPRPLSCPSYMDFFAAEPDRTPRLFDHQISSHNRPSEITPDLRRTPQRLTRRLDSRLNLVHRQKMTNHTSRAHQHIAWLNSRDSTDSLTDSPRILQPPGPGTRIGIARINEHRLRPPGTNMLPAHLNRRPNYLVSRKRPSGHTRPISNNQPQIERTTLLNPSPNRRSPKPHRRNNSYLSHNILFLTLI